MSDLRDDVCVFCAFLKIEGGISPHFEVGEDVLP